MLSGPQIIFFALESNTHPTGTVPNLGTGQCRLRPSTASGGHVDAERTEETIYPLQKPQELRRCDPGIVVSGPRMPGWTDEKLWA